MRTLNYVSEVFVVVGIVATLAGSAGGCGFKKNDPVGAAAGGEGGDAAGATSMQLGPNDWVIESGSYGKAQATVKTIKAEKVEFVRRNFRVPRMYAITVPESNGFELYELRGYRELENAVYIQPKVYINTGNGQGQVLGYRTGKKDPVGKDLIEISVPVALVNGLVTNLPTLGGPSSGVGAAVSLPAKYQIPDLNALKARVSKDVATLPVCPRLFRLTFEGREYWAKSPFEILSACPMNQFFRISFEAPVEEMKHLLETAAVRDEAVGIITSLQVAFDLPRRIVDVSFAPADFGGTLADVLKNYPASGQDGAGKPGHAVQDIEDAVIQSLFDLAKGAGFDAQYSASLLSVVSPLVASYFGSPYACGSGATCRSLLRYPTQRVRVQYSWMESEALAAALETETVTGLGAVANSSDYIAKPATDEFALVRRPAYFRGRQFKDVIAECRQLIEADFAFMPENTEDAQKYFKAYCRAVVGNAGSAQNIAADQDDDGYYPLGSNTVVYPGAWLKIDIDDISEFTTAKTKTLSDGRIVVESEVVDLLALDPNAKRTQCLDGNAIACVEYKTRQISVRTPSGDHTYTNEPCTKGDQGCDCVRSNHSDGTPGEVVCTRKQYQFQEVMDYACDQKDEYEYCPYWRNQEEVVDYEIEHECQNVKVEDKSTFLCLGGCSEHTELQCREKSRKPVKAIRQRLNCKEDDPVGTAFHEKVCRAPKYKCKKWATSCTRYMVNEVFHVVHEDIVPKWRPFAIQKGEYPKRFEEDIYLKFVSPGRTVTNCKLNRFAREFRGNSIYIKMPSEKNEGIQPCDQPLWDEKNTQALYLPKVFIKNAISYPERRMCGKTEYSFTTKEVPLSDSDGLVPPQFSHQTETHIGPIPNACLAENPVQIGPDLWFTEYPPIRFSGRVSVLGRVLESIVTEVRQ